MTNRESRIEALDRMTATVDTSVRPLIDVTERPRIRKALRVLGRISAALVLASFAFGTVMIATMLEWAWVAAGVVLLALVPLLLDPLARRSRLAHVVAITLFGVVVPIVVLLGFDVVWSWARLPRLSPEVGLVVAGVVVAAAAYGYLRWLGRPPPRRPGLWALYGVVSALSLRALTAQEVPSFNLIWTALAVGAATLFYLRRAAGPEIRRPLWWALLIAGVLVVLAPLLAEAIRGERTSVVLLLAGGLIAIITGLNGLWSRRGSERLGQARQTFAVALVVGVAVPCLTLAVASLASSPPSATQEVPLPVAAGPNPLPQAAFDHRPILLFDSGERFRTPLDIDAMLASDDVELCPEGRGLLAECRTVNGASDLRNGVGNLRFDSQAVEDDVDTTTIYAHAVPDELHPGWTDIDYWWYLPDNPANTAQGAMCGAGLVIPEITCFDHQSDWEGVTVVVDEDQSPVAVHYAAHDHVIQVPWGTLQAAAGGNALRPYTAGRDVAHHPLVFVAHGTHASYPLPCKSSVCSGANVFEDQRHDGAHEWPEEKCVGDRCVSGFPIAQGGGKASWNAFDGHWGSAVCITKELYCARSAAPRAPGTQGRYKRPWCYDFATGSDLAHPRDTTPLPTGCE